MDPNQQIQPIQTETPLQQPVSKIPSSRNKWKLIIKIIIIIGAIIICTPFIWSDLRNIFDIIFPNFGISSEIGSEMSTEEAEKIAEQAVIKGDLNTCYKISIAENMNYEYGCIAHVAATLQDESICKKIPESNDWLSACYKEIAKSKGDSLLCEKIFGDVGKKSCYEEVAVETNNSDLCNKVGYDQLPDADNCFYDIAINTQNQELCNQLQDYGWHTKCINELKEK